MWSTRDDHRCTTHMNTSPSQLRERLSARTGIPPATAMIHAALLVERIKAKIHGIAELRQMLDSLTSRAEHASEWERTRLLISEHLTGTTQELAATLRATSSDKRWGSLPKTLPTAMLNTPVIQTKHSVRIWSLHVFSAAMADLPRRVLTDDGLHPRTVGGDIGRLFEAYIEDRLSSLAHSRWVTDDELATTTAGSKPDFVIAHAGDAVAVEAHAGRLDLRSVTGETGAASDVVGHYRDKFSQARAVSENLAATGALFGLHRLRSAWPLVVLNDPLVFTPRMAELADGNDPPFVCGVDEFDMLLDLELLGWSIPSLIEVWQTANKGMLLGHSLYRAASVRGAPDAPLVRLLAAFQSHFGSPPIARSA